ncbi:WSC-domain-containing protein [Pholiota conissans]|uniref:WSC-domain-containing protein n=1 Tax=Pholiota conissans TaxID=109636 RepID=A0A9P6CZH4_9AGAR|nr:WSC-domain-containing protein [Pholiota conissans]
MVSRVLFRYCLSIAGLSVLCAYASPTLDARQTAGWTSIGCYSDSTASRTLEIASFTSVDAMTIEACTTFCTPAGYKYSGVEFGRFINPIKQPPRNVGVPANDGGCNMPCTGNAAEICGGPNRINVFQNSASSPPPPPPPLTTTTTTTTTPPAPTPTIKTTVGTFQYKGCFWDVVNTNQRTLANGVTVPGGVSIDGCTAACKAAGYPLAGLEFGQECWCDTYMELVNHTPDADCNKPCQADATELCGSGNRLAVYQDTAAALPDPQKCLTNFQILHDFDIQAIPSPNGGAPTTIGALNIASAVQNGNTEVWYILSKDNGTGFTQNDFFFGTTGNPNSNLFWMDRNFGASLAPIIGEAQLFVTSDKISVDPYNQYCPKPNPQSQFGPFIGPAVISVNGHFDDWALCPNTTAGGDRIDLVFSPIATSPHYTLSSCQSVILQMTVCHKLKNGGQKPTDVTYLCKVHNQALTTKDALNVSYPGFHHQRQFLHKLLAGTAILRVK